MHKVAHGAIRTQMYGYDIHLQAKICAYLARRVNLTLSENEVNNLPKTANREHSGAIRRKVPPVTSLQNQWQDHDGDSPLIMHSLSSGHREANILRALRPSAMSHDKNVDQLPVIARSNLISTHRMFSRVYRNRKVVTPSTLVTERL